jgi:hypothetical protein
MYRVSKPYYRNLEKQMKFKLLLLLVGFIPALAMAEGHKPAPEKALPGVVRPAVVETHVHHYHYHYGMGFQPPRAIHHYYQSGPPQISGKPRMEGGAREQNYATENPPLWGNQSGPPKISGKPPMEGGAREERMLPEMMLPGRNPLQYMSPQQVQQYLESLPPNQNDQGYCGNAGNPC